MGVYGGEDGHRLPPGLHTEAIGSLDLSGEERMICQFGGPGSLALKHGQGALVQDLPPRLAQVRIDHVADQVMREAIAARTTSLCLVLAQDATLDGLLQSLQACVCSLSSGQAAQLGHLPEKLR